MVEIWNEVVRDGIAYPQENELDLAAGTEFFAAQSSCGVAVDETGWGSIFCIPTTSAGAAISQTQATPWAARPEAFTSASSSCSTV